MITCPYHAENIHAEFGTNPSIGSVISLHLTLRAWNSKQEDWNSDPDVHLEDAISWKFWLARVPCTCFIGSDVLSGFYHLLQFSDITSA